jgi:hypothetical protein
MRLQIPDSLDSSTISLSGMISERQERDTRKLMTFMVALAMPLAALAGLAGTTQPAIAVAP